MTMVAKTGLLTEVLASHIDQHPFHQIVLSTVTTISSSFNPSVISMNSRISDRS